MPRQPAEHWRESPWKRGIPGCRVHAARGRLHWARARTSSSRDRLPVRPRRCADPDRLGAQRGVETDVRRVPADVVRAARAAVRAVRLRRRLPPSTSTAGRAPTASAPSSPRAASPCPRATPDDGPDAETVNGIGNRKNVLRPAEDPRGRGRRSIAGSVDYLHAAKAAGLRRAVVSASANCTRRAARRPASPTCSRYASTASSPASEDLPGKPAPDTFLDGARAARRRARRTAPSSRTPWPASPPAGPASSAIVVGVDRVGQADALRRHGADIVVHDLSELLTR